MKYYLRFLLLFLVSILPLTTVMGQLPEYPVRKFTAEHGIQHGIIKIAQDTRGFMWLMYRNKIQLFDGKYMDTWFKSENIYSLFIFNKSL